MAKTGLILNYIIAGYIRYWLITSDYQEVIADHVEVSTPVNSWKRIEEGLYLKQNNINPYSGDGLHESPLIILAYEKTIAFLGENFPFVFIFADLLTAYVLYSVCALYMFKLYAEQEKNKQNYAKDAESLLLKAQDFVLPPYYVLAAYLYNPFTIFNCVGQTTTVFGNFFLSLFFYGLVGDHLLLSAFSLAAVATHSFYPIMLLVPLFLKIYLVDSRPRKAFFAIFLSIAFVVMFLAVSFLYCKNWDFVDDTFGFILKVPDLRPNIGLFWYFFIEMFDHFRTLFIYSFQINATILYLIPLSITFRKNPLILSLSLLSLIAIFKSYPCVGDVGFVLALFPFWTHLFDYMQQGFLVGVNILVSSALGPIVWHLWIYSRSANANFYFGVTLAFAVAQIFLITDVLFAYVKREFSLKHGRIRKINGEEATLVLE